jgi:hypothetical protein
MILKNKRTYRGPGQYIGRPSILGNPVKVGSICKFCGKLHSNGESTLDCYKKYFYARIKWDEIFYREARGILERADILVCWCAPDPCHGDVLIDWKNKGYPRKQG